MLNFNNLDDISVFGLDCNNENPDDILGVSKTN
jgi:hypothetical protein